MAIFSFRVVLFQPKFLNANIWEEIHVKENSCLKNFLFLKKISWDFDKLLNVFQQNGKCVDCWNYAKICSSFETIFIFSQFFWSTLEYKAKTTHTTMSIKFKIHSWTLWFLTLLTLWYALFLFCTPVTYNFRFWFLRKFSYPDFLNCHIFLCSMVIGTCIVNIITIYSKLFGNGPLFFLIKFTQSSQKINSRKFLHNHHATAISTLR